MKSTRAKVLFEVGGASMIRWTVRRAMDVGSAPVVIVVGHEAESVQAEVEAHFPGRAQFALQSERLGTGHAARIGLAELDNFTGTVLILYGDVPLLSANSLLSLIEEIEPGTPVAFLSTEVADPTGYGRVVRDEALNVVRIVEHRDASRAERAIREINAGIYAVEAEFLRSALERLSNDNAQGEYYLTDIVDIALQQDLKVESQLVHPEEVLGANDRRQLAILEATANRRIIETHLDNGVTFLDPNRTSVELDVQIEPDAVIHPGVHLRGRTFIGARCVVDVGSIITDSEIAPEVTVHPYSVLERARVATGCNVGPFARLRPETVLEAGARVGNFVEIKKTTLGPGAKANHLAYLGDASVGAEANVGAGTITCNYDGVAKNRTDIGPGVFVGSNSTLVAPLQIGDNAFVAAGSVLTEAVPDEALALGRARQTNKPDRAPAIREAAVARKKAKQGK